MAERQTASEQSRALVAVGHAGGVTLIEATTGRLLWERQLAELPAGLPCEGQPVTVRIVAETVVAACSGHVFAFRVDDGELLWQLNRRSRGAGETNLATERD